MLYILICCLKQKGISEPTLSKYGCQHEMSHCNRLKTSCSIQHQTDLPLNIGLEIVNLATYRIASTVVQGVREASEKLQLSASLKPQQRAGTASSCRFEKGLKNLSPFVLLLCYKVLIITIASCRLEWYELHLTF